MHRQPYCSLYIEKQYRPRERNAADSPSRRFKQSTGRQERAGVPRSPVGVGHRMQCKPAMKTGWEWADDICRICNRHGINRRAIRAWPCGNRPTLAKGRLRTERPSPEDPGTSPSTLYIFNAALAQPLQLSIRSRRTDSMDLIRRSCVV